ncbi:MAG: hypothetical protein IT372_16280 [Polyangiaceae bacterium]|nr:hypothetical protein [Polyangiaceae bacterium]
MIPWLGFERRWRDAVLAAVIPADGAPGVGALEPAEIEAFWPAFRAHAPPLVRAGLRLAVWAVSLAPPLVVGAGRTFAALGRDDQERVLVAFRSSRVYLVRQLAVALVAVACLAYGTVPRLRAGVSR